MNEKTSTLHLGPENMIAFYTEGILFFFFLLKHLPNTFHKTVRGHQKSAQITRFISSLKKSNSSSPQKKRAGKGLSSIVYVFSKTETRQLLMYYLSKRKSQSVEEFKQSPPSALSVL